jgi:hypothetical protein
VGDFLGLCLDVVDGLAVLGLLPFWVLKRMVRPEAANRVTPAEMLVSTEALKPERFWKAVVVIRRVMLAAIIRFLIFMVLVPVSSSCLV